MERLTTNWDHLRQMVLCAICPKFSSKFREYVCIKKHHKKVFPIRMRAPLQKIPISNSNGWDDPFAVMTKDERIRMEALYTSVIEKSSNDESIAQIVGSIDKIYVPSSLQSLNIVLCPLDAEWLFSIHPKYVLDPQTIMDKVHFY